MIRTLFINRGKKRRSEIMSGEGAQRLQERCETAYVEQGLALVAEGIMPSLVENAAFASGLPKGPLAAGGEDPGKFAANTKIVAAQSVQQRLLCCQALAAAECWEEGLTDPVEADLASTLGWGFPSYTGGVLSFIDTMGLNAFVSLCHQLSSGTQAKLKPSAWLLAKAQESDRIYKSLAK